MYIYIYNFSVVFCIKMSARCGHQWLSSIRMQIIIHNGHRMAAYTKTPKLQFDLSMCDISVDVNKGQMHNAERPVKCDTQSKKTAAFFKHAHHPTGYHEL